jgi:hypothetical protein
MQLATKGTSKSSLPWTSPMAKTWVSPVMNVLLLESVFSLADDRVLIKSKDFAAAFASAYASV